MGKSLTATQLQQFTKSIIPSSHKPKSPKPTLKTSPPPREVRLDSVPFKTNSNNNSINKKKIVMEESSSSSNSSVSLDGKRRVPLAHVVSDCVNRWFQDTLKEAKAGDVTMQVLVSQMYFNGYGVPKNLDMAYEWIRKATRTRHSAWKVYEKRPGYNVSDSNSDEPEDEI